MMYIYYVKVFHTEGAPIVERIYAYTADEARNKAGKNLNGVYATEIIDKCRQVTYN